ncbi:MAG: hypothetical protein R2879_01060 [Saprospiraceae bacterium]
MLRKATFMIILCCTLGVVTAQVTFQPKQPTYEESKGIIYNKEFTVDLKFLQTNGFAIGVNSAKLKTYYLTNFYHFEFGELKHIREYRQQSFESLGFNGIAGGNSFIYGKKNSFFTLRVGYGQKRYFSEKAKTKGLAVGISYEGGPTLGMLKPYYLDLAYPIDNGRDVFYQSQKYSEDNADVFLDRNRVKGSTGFTKGLTELSLVPGVHLQGSVHFDWGAFDEFVKALEVGFMADLFVRNVPIMVEVDGIENRPYFLNVFINLQLGKRW